MKDLARIIVPLKYAIFPDESNTAILEDEVVEQEKRAFIKAKLEPLLKKGGDAGQGGEWLHISEDKLVWFLLTFPRLF